MSLRLQWEWVDALYSWWFWFGMGWPWRRRCGQCAGSGKYCSEAEARMADPQYGACGMCCGTGVVTRPA